MANKQSDEEYVVKLSVETDEALSAIKKWREEVDATKKELLELRNLSKEPLKTVAKGFLDAKDSAQMFGEELKRVKQATSAAVQEINAEDRALEKTNQTMGESTAQTKGFGTVIQTAFGFSLGTIAVKAIRKFIAVLREGMEAAGEFSMDVARLEVNLRAFQRTGGDLQFSDMINLMEDLREQYKIFSEQEMVSATQEILHWGRQLDLTGQQVKDLLAVSTQMSVIMGQDLPTSIRQVTTAAITGRTQSLRPYGVALDGTKIKTLALEQGLIGVGEELTNNDKLTIILQATQKVLNETAGETVEILNNLGGSQKIVSIAWQNLKKDMAEGFAPAAKIVLDWVGKLIEGFNAFVNTYKKVSIFLNTSLVVSLKGATVAFQNFWNAVKGSDERIDFDFFDEFDKRFKELEKRFFPLEGLINEDIGAEDIFPVLDPNAVEDTGEDIVNKYKDLGIKIRETLIDEQDKLEEAEENHLEKLDELNARYLENKEQSEIKHDNDIAQINRKFNDELADKNDDFRDRELGAEEDFQEKLRKLREDFLLDLEDALRERDAKQVLSLIRRFNLREKQLKRQEDINKKQRARTFQDQISDIKRRRDIRIREAEFEFAERRALAQRDHNFQTALENQRFEQRKADIMEETQIRIDELIRRFEDEAAITEDGAKQVRDILQEYFGAGGETDKIYNHLISKTAGTLSAVSTMISMMAQQLASIGGTPMAEQADFIKAESEMAWRDWMRNSAKGKSGTGFAEGGTLLAMKPTTVQFGEKEPEIATFSPLSRIGRNEGKTFVNGNGSGGGNSKVQIELLLSQDLIARTENKVLSGAAEIIMRKSR